MRQSFVTVSAYFAGLAVLFAGHGLLAESRAGKLIYVSKFKSVDELKSLSEESGMVLIVVGDAVFLPSPVCLSDHLVAGDASGRTALGDSSGRVSGGDTSGRKGGGDSSGRVAGGDASGRVSGGDASGRKGGGDSSGRVAGGDTSGRVAGGDSSQRLYLADHDEHRWSGSFANFSCYRTRTGFRLSDPPVRQARYYYGGSFLSPKNGVVPF